MVAPKIGDAGIERVRLMARRKYGVTIPEVQEECDVGYYCARRFVMRLIREGILRRTDERRRRTEIFDQPRGAGGVVYRTTSRGVQRQKGTIWESSRKLRARKR